MSGTDDGNDGRATANERLDRLLSLRQDGALDATEAAELEGLLAASEAARERARAFVEVDESLRRLVARAIPPARLARGLEALERRVAAGQAGSAASRPAPRRPLSRRKMSGLGFGLAAAAAAAALVLALLVSPRGDGGDEPLPESVAATDRRPDAGPDAGPDARREASLDSSAEPSPDPRLDERATEIADVGGAAEELASLGIEDAGDLEVIDELELLDFLATHTPLPEGPRG